MIPMNEACSARILMLLPVPKPLDFAVPAMKSRTTIP
jgi:hypothetical protein